MTLFGYLRGVPINDKKSFAERYVLRYVKKACISIKYAGMNSAGVPEYSVAVRERRRNYGEPSRLADFLTEMPLPDSKPLGEKKRFNYETAVMHAATAGGILDESSIEIHVVDEVLNKPPMPYNDFVGECLCFIELASSSMR